MQVASSGSGLPLGEEGGYQLRKGLVQQKPSDDGGLLFNSSFSDI
jgi:hypothetical protein